MWMAWPERSGGWKVVEGGRESLWIQRRDFVLRRREGGEGRRGTLVFEGVGKRWKMGWNASQPTPHQRRRESGREVGLGRK